MKLFSHPIAVFAGLALLAAGCGVESTYAGPDGVPSLTPLDGPNGHGGTNGLPPNLYQPVREDLDELLKLPLLVDGRLNRDTLFSNFLAEQKRIFVFSEAVGCALGIGTTLETQFGTFSGEGFMAHTGSWTKDGLDFQKRMDVHTCLVTRLNPYGEKVPIWIGGPDTAKDTDGVPYDFSEAVWSVNVDSDGFHFLVWPSETYTEHTACGQSLPLKTADFGTRLCDDHPESCDVQIKDDFDTACTGHPGKGDWICYGVPAIETRLHELDWVRMHPLCPILPP